MCAEMYFSGIVEDCTLFMLAVCCVLQFAAAWRWGARTMRGAVAKLRRSGRSVLLALAFMTGFLVVHAQKRGAADGLANGIAGVAREAASLADGRADRTDAGDGTAGTQCGLRSGGMAQGLTDEDYAAGFALAGVGTNETHDFSAPAWAVACEPWLGRGASWDWFRTDLVAFSFPFGTNAVDALTIYAFGEVRVRPHDAATCIAPLRASLDIVPSFNWWMLDETARPSQFWHGVSPSGSYVLTWQNALLNRDATKPVSFQAELHGDGCVDFRYNLSHVAASDLTNATASLQNGGLGFVTNIADTATTSLRFQRLDPVDVANPDPDGDGISTDDEVLVYHTDPYSTDTDRDELSDYDELFLYASDPCDAHSINGDIIDSLALVIGDADPFSCPPGSTNTVWEHVFYTGTTNAPIAYPQRTADAAVLRVSVTGTGGGELFVGDAMVPLLGCGAATNTLRLVVGKGVRKNIRFLGVGDLGVSLDSDDFMVGNLSSGSDFRWVAFPRTEATVPCIHDAQANSRAVTLPCGGDFPGLSASWSSPAEDVAITNRPPFSATIHARFGRDESREIGYTLSHPQYICGEATFAQTFRFCPPIPEEELDVTGAQDGGSGPSAWEGDDPLCEDTTSEEEAAAEFAAASVLPLARTLQLHGSARSESLDVEVPRGEGPRCCECPEHWMTNYAAVVAVSPRIRAAYADGGGAFTRTDRDACIEVFGTEPSVAPRAEKFLIVTNGAEYLSRRYTVLGLDIEKPSGPSLAEYEGLNPGFGCPVTLCTNVENAAELDLVTDVSLSNGFVRVALSNVTGSFQIWLPEYATSGHGWQTVVVPAVKLLDSNGQRERHFTMRQWRDLVRRYGFLSSRKLTVKVLSSAVGHCDLDFAYVLDHDDTAIKSSVRRRITSVNPPLLPDYDYDGGVGATDIVRFMRRPTFHYWINECKISGDVWEELSLFEGIADALSGLENWRNNHVDGRYDLINLFPLAIMADPFVDAWGGCGDVNIKISPLDGNDAFRFTLASVSHSEAGSIRTAPHNNIVGQPLHSATMNWLTDAVTISAYAYANDFDAGSALLVCESAKASWMGLVLSVEVDGTTMYSFRLPMRMRTVDEMYRYVDIRGAFEDPDMELTGTGAPPNNPEAEAYDRDVFFVHGFNVSPENARNWNREMFKRFWVSGMKARYWGVTWSGDYHLGWPNFIAENFNGLHYHRDVRQALMSAPTFARLVNTYGSNAVVIGHSLGNMVVSEALLNDMNAKTYIMLDAAVASEAYRPELQADSSEIVDKYVPADWDGYHERTWAANWYTWFTNNTDDARADIGWAGHFAPLLDRQGLTVYNFYSSGDEVFNETTNGTPGLVTGVFHWPTLNLDWPFFHLNWELDAYPWQKQEVFKGVNVAGSLSAGWGFHCWETNINNQSVWDRYSAVDANAMVADGSIVTNAVFDRGVSAMFNSTISGYDKADILAFHIPAVSSPAGKVPTLPDKNFYFDMNVKARVNDWGREGEIVTDAQGQQHVETPWLHSDIKNMAYYYVYPAFTNIVEKGEMR